MLKCLLDLDGVLVDFGKGAAELHNREYPYNDPKNLGIFDLEKLWNIPLDDFFKGMEFDFWSNLPKMHDCDEILKLVVEKFGINNICILSTPTNNLNCMAGKLHWIQTHIPEFKRRFLFGSKKEFTANPKHVLIDDKDKNITNFIKGGGIGILCPRPWNSNHPLETLPFLKKALR